MKFNKNILLALITLSFTNAMMPYSKVAPNLATPPIGGQAGTWSLQAQVSTLFAQVKALQERVEQLEARFTTSDDVVAITKTTPAKNRKQDIK